MEVVDARARVRVRVRVRLVGWLVGWLIRWESLVDVDDEVSARSCRRVRSECVFVLR